MLQLNAEKREILGKKLKKSRSEGKLPAVLYGKGKESSSLFVNLNEFKKIWSKAEESSMIKLDLGDKKSEDVMIYDVSIDPVKREFIHVDFCAIDINKPVETEVQILFEGVSSAVKEQGGVLVKVMHKLEIEALPKNLPHEIKVDVSKLAKIGDKISVKDISLPEGVKALAKPDAIVVLAKPHEEEKAEEQVRTVEDVELSEKRGKKEEEGVEGEAGKASEAKKEGKK